MTHSQPATVTLSGDDSIEEVFDAVDSFFREKFSDSRAWTQVEGDGWKRIGLDPRAYVTMYVPTEEGEEEFIVTRGRTNSLEYYGGFEYVEKSAVTRVGEWTFWSAEDSRVARHLDRWFYRERDEEEEEDED